MHMYISLLEVVVSMLSVTHICKYNYSFLRKYRFNTINFLHEVIWLQQQKQVLGGLMKW